MQTFSFTWTKAFPEEAVVLIVVKPFKRSSSYKRDFLRVQVMWFFKNVPCQLYKLCNGADTIWLYSVPKILAHWISRLFPRFFCCCVACVKVAACAIFIACWRYDKFWKKLHHQCEQKVTCVATDSFKFSPTDKPVLRGHLKERSSVFLNTRIHPIQDSDFWHYWNSELLSWTTRKCFYIAFQSSKNQTYWINQTKYLDFIELTLGQ